VPKFLCLRKSMFTRVVTHGADLRAVIATLQAPERVPAAIEAEAPTLVLESTPEPGTKKPAARRRGQTSQGAT